MIERIIKRLLKLKIVTRIDCWETSLSASQNGYVRIIDIDGKKYPIHRISAAYYLGLDYYNYNLLALHLNKCHNKRCWNPNHLYIGTSSDNLKDRQELGTYYHNHKNKTHCKNGHPLEGDNVKKTRLQRVCQICKKEAQKKYREKTK